MPKSRRSESHRRTFQCQRGDKIDVYSKEDQSWYVSTVLDPNPNHFHIHFELWHSKHDCIIPRHRFNEWLAPLHTYTQPLVPEAGYDFVNEFSCTICGEGGDVICCDTCPKVFHVGCIRLVQPPEEEFQCAFCQTKKEKQKLTNSTNYSNVKQEDAATTTHAPLPSAIYSNSAATAAAATFAYSSSPFASLSSCVVAPLPSTFSSSLTSNADEREHKSAHRFDHSTVVSSPLPSSSTPPSDNDNSQYVPTCSTSPGDSDDSDELPTSKDNDAHSHISIDSDESVTFHHSHTHPTPSRSPLSDSPMEEQKSSPSPFPPPILSQPNDRQSAAASSAIAPTAGEAMKPVDTTTDMNQHSVDFGADWSNTLELPFAYDDPFSAIYEDDVELQIPCFKCGSSGFNVFTCSSCQLSYHSTCNEHIVLDLSPSDDCRLCTSCIQSKHSAKEYILSEQELTMKMKMKGEGEEEEKKMDDHTEAPSPSIDETIQTSTDVDAVDSQSFVRKTSLPSTSSISTSKKSLHKSTTTSSSTSKSSSSAGRGRPRKPHILDSTSSNSNQHQTTDHTHQNTTVEETNSQAQQKMNARRYYMPKLRSDNIAALAVLLRKIHWLFVHEPTATPDVPPPACSSSIASASSSHLSSSLSSATSSNSVFTSPVASSSSSPSSSSSNPQQSSLPPMPDYLHRNACHCKDLFGPNRKYPQEPLNLNEMKMIRQELMQMRDQLWNHVYALQTVYDHLDAQWHEDITFYCIHLNELRPLLIHEQARANLTSLSITQLDMYLMKEAEYRTSPSSMAATAAASSSPPSSAATSFRPLSTDSSHRASCDKLRLIRQTMSDSEASFYQIKAVFDVAFEPPFRRFADIDLLYQILVDVADYLIHEYPSQPSNWHIELQKLWSLHLSIQSSQTEEAATTAETLVLDAFKRAPFDKSEPNRQAQPTKITPIYKCFQKGCNRTDQFKPRLLEHVLEEHVRPLKRQLHKIEIDTKTHRNHINQPEQHVTSSSPSSSAVAAAAASSTIEPMQIDSSPVAGSSPSPPPSSASPSTSTRSSSQLCYVPSFLTQCKSLTDPTMFACLSRLFELPTIATQLDTMMNQFAEEKAKLTTTTMNSSKRKATDDDTASISKKVKLSPSDNSTKSVSTECHSYPPIDDPYQWQLYQMLSTLIYQKNPSIRQAVGDLTSHHSQSGSPTPSPLLSPFQSTPPTTDGSKETSSNYSIDIRP